MVKSPVKSVLGQHVGLSTHWWLDSDGKGLGVEKKDVSIRNF